MKTNFIITNSFKTELQAGLPMALTFMSSFLAVGSYLNDAGLDLSQSVLMTISTFASPAQYVVADSIKHGTSISILATAIIAINSRFLVMASSLIRPFKGISLSRIFFAMPLLTATTFAVTKSENADSNNDAFEFFIGVGIVGLTAAIVATAVGHKIHDFIDPKTARCFDMILPLYFGALMTSNEKFKRNIFLIGAVLAMLLNQYLGNFLLILGVLAGGAFSTLTKGWSK